MSRSTRRIVVLALLAAGCTGLSPVGPIRPAPANAADTTASQKGQDVEPMYQIGPGDVLSITVFGENDLSGSYTVRPDGRLMLPLVETFDVSGKTSMEVADFLETELADFVQDPRVSVNVAVATGTFQNQIRVIGSSVSPQSLRYRAGMTALDVLTELGGVSEYAARDDAYILRRVGGDLQRIPVDLGTLTETGDRTANVAMRPGDVLVVPEGFLTGDVRFSQSAFFRQTYTDNVDQDPDDQKVDALITEVGPQASLSADLARVSGALNTSLTFQRQSLNREADDLDLRLAGAGNAEWVEDVFFTDVAASVSQQNLVSSEAQSASDVGNGNQSTVQTYQVSPYLQQTFGRIAELEYRYTANATLIGADDAERQQDEDPRFGDTAAGNRASDSFQQVASITASSGPTFGRYTWSVVGRASEQQFSSDGNARDDDDVSQRSVQLNNEYALMRGVALLGTIGYETLDSGDEADNYDSPIWNVGVRYEPSPDTTMEARVGQRAEQETFSANVQQQIGGRTSLRLSYQERIATGQERLVADIPTEQELRQDPSLFSDQATFTIRDQVTRTQTLRFGANTAIGRNDLGFNASYVTEQEDVIDGEDTEETYNIGVSFRRPLTRDLDLSLNASYSNTTLSGDLVETARDTNTIEDDVYRASASLNYQAFQNISFGIRYSYAERVSSEPQDDFTENAITLSGRITF